MAGRGIIRNWNVDLPEPDESRRQSGELHHGWHASHIDGEGFIADSYAAADEVDFETVQCDDLRPALGQMGQAAQRGAARLPWSQSRPPFRRVLTSVVPSARFAFDSRTAAAKIDWGLEASWITYRTRGILCVAGCGVRTGTKSGMHGNQIVGA